MSSINQWKPKLTISLIPENDDTQPTKIEESAENRKRKLDAVPMRDNPAHDPNIQSLVNHSLIPQYLESQRNLRLGHLIGKGTDGNVHQILNSKGNLTSTLIKLFSNSPSFDSIRGDYLAVKNRMHGVKAEALFVHPDYDHLENSTISNVYSEGALLAGLLMENGGVPLSKFVNSFDSWELQKKRNYREKHFNCRFLFKKFGNCPSRH